MDYADRLRSFGEAVKRQSLLSEENHTSPINVSKADVMSIDKTKS